MKLTIKKAKVERVFLKKQNEWKGYSVMAVLDKDKNKEDIEKLKQTIQGEFVGVFQNAMNKTIEEARELFKSPLYDADNDTRPNGEPFSEEYKNCYVITFRAKTQLDEIDGKEIKNGDYCKLSVNIYGYGFNKRIGASAQVLKIRKLGE